MSSADAIENLYRVFDRYPLRPWTEPCSCCHEAGEERVLHERELRQLSADDLSGFVADALLIWGDLGDFKHFLPRIMEITVTAGGSDWRRQGWVDWPDTESIFSRFTYGDWHAWPEIERQAVQLLLVAWWEASLCLYPARDDIGSMLTALACAGADLQPFLDGWLELPGAPPLQHLAELVEKHAPILMTRNRLANAYWGVKQRPAAGPLRSWLKSGCPRQRLVDGFFDAEDGTVEAALSEAVRVLEALGA